MSRYNLYTALIGILSVFFMLSVALNNFSFAAKTFFFASEPQSSGTVRGRCTAL